MNKKRLDALNNLHMKMTNIKLPEFLSLGILPAQESAYRVKNSNILIFSSIKKKLG